MIYKKIIFFLVIALVTLNIYIGQSYSDEIKNNLRFAYVACADKSVYIVDIMKNKLVHKTDEFAPLGTPTEIAIDQKHQKIYVANERGDWQYKYSAIVIFDITTLPINVLKEMDLIIDKPNGPFIGVSAVYGILVSSDGKTLYALYAHPSYQGTTVIDSETGKIKGLLDFYINRGSVFSPDGKAIAEMWPSGSKIIEKDGDKKLMEWSGGVAVYDIEKNKMISRKEIQKDGIGLQPPWGKIEAPFIYLKDYKMLEMYNRETGKIISQIDIVDITGGLITADRYPFSFDNNKKIILSMTDNATKTDKMRKGYVVVIDLVKKKIVSKIEVGPSPTNVVLSSFMPKQKK